MHIMYMHVRAFAISELISAELVRGIYSCVLVHFVALCATCLACTHITYCIFPTLLDFIARLDSEPMRTRICVT